MCLTCKNHYCDVPVVQEVSPCVFFVNNFVNQRCEQIIDKDKSLQDGHCDYWPIIASVVFCFKCIFKSRHVFIVHYLHEWLRDSDHIRAQ